MPWTHDWSIASAPRGDMKSLDVAEFLKFLWFSYDFNKSARAGNLQFFLVKKHWFFNVFMLKSLQTQCVWYDFGMRARVSTLWYFLHGIIENRRFKIKDGARMVLFDKDEGGDTGTGWDGMNSYGKRTRGQDHI